MAVELRNAAGLPEVDAYKSIAIATGSRTVYMAGQVSWDAEGNTVAEGDLAGQIEQCLLNVGRALDAAGATYADVVKITMYVVDWAAEKIDAVGDGMGRAAAQLGTSATPPATLIGVAALDIPEHLVEIEAIAVID